MSQDVVAERDNLGGALTGVARHIRERAAVFCESPPGRLEANLSRRQA